MEFDAVLLAPRRAESKARGYWHDRTINDYLEACLDACPDKVALTAIRVDTRDERRFTYLELAALADRAAVGLSRLGVGRNDVVAMQLPNWWQFSVLYLACSRIGAVVNPLMPIFRERELSFMLRHGEAKLLIVPKTFRNFDHEAMARALQPTLTSLKRIVVVGGDGQVSIGQTVIKSNARKVRKLGKGDVIGGFAGATADAFTLFERLESKLEQYPGQLTRAAVELAKDWRTDRYLRRLEAMMIVADRDVSLVLTGTGDVLEPEAGVMAIGSGGNYALAAARALVDSDKDAETIVRRALDIAADICVYTNRNLTIETLGG